MNRKLIENMVPVTELANKASATVQKAEDGQTQFIVKRNKIVAVLINIDLYLAIAELSRDWHKDLDDGEWENIIDYAQTVLAVRHAKESMEGADSLPTLSFDELLKKHGMTREELN